MRINIHWLVLCALPMIYTACSTRYTPPRSEVMQQAESQGLPYRTIDEDRERFFSYEKDAEKQLMTLLESRSQGAQDPNYTIGGGDTLEINVFDVEELNVVRQVSRSGILVLPLIGAVEVQGRTVAEVEQDIEAKLGRYVRNPQSSVFVAEYGSQVVSVIGAVERPGSYPLQKGVNNILELLSRAGGVTKEAGSYLTFIPGEELTESNAAYRARMAIESLQESATQSKKGVEIPLPKILGTDGGVPIDLPVRGSDMIVVAKSGQVMVDGEVQKRGSYQLGSRMTVLGALAAAGGITYSAKVDEIEIIRNINEDSPARLVIDLEDFMQGRSKDILLRDGDVVRVPSDSARRVTQNTFEGLSRIINFGVGSSYNVGN